MSVSRPASRANDWPSLNLVEGLACGHALHHFSYSLMKAHPIIKAFNQSCQIVVVGLHIVLRSLLSLVQSSKDQTDEAPTIYRHFITAKKGR